MKTLIFGTLFFLSSCVVVSLAATAVSTKIKIVEVPLKVVGTILQDDEDEEKKENE